MENQKWYRVTKSALEDYRQFVNGNKNEENMMCYKKINRNIRCGRLVFERESGTMVIGYGSMRIGVRDNHVLWIENRIYPVVPINYELKDKLDIEWGIKTIEDIKPKEIETVPVKHEFKNMNMFSMLKLLHINQ